MIVVADVAVLVDAAGGDDGVVELELADIVGGLLAEHPGIHLPHEAAGYRDGEAAALAERGRGA